MTAPHETNGKADLAKEQASRVTDTAQQHASAVADTAKDQAGQVVGDAKAHAQDLLGQTTDQISQQADEQTQRLSGNLQQLSDHFATMAGSGEPGSTARTLVEEVSRRSSDLAGYLDNRPSGQIVDDVKDFARRRPGAFILGSAVAGLLVGRLGREVKDAPASEPTSTADGVPDAYPAVPREQVSVVPTAGTLGGGL
jgi:hypothetical protein